MENATKALLIAAAIIIAVVLITLGVFVLGNGTTMVKENSDMTETQVTAYNNKFESYFGTKVSGSKVKQLVNTVNQHNRNAEDDSKQIELTGEFITGTIDSGYTLNNGTFKVGNTYNVHVDTDVETSGYTNMGLIAGIKIE